MSSSSSSSSVSINSNRSKKNNLKMNARRAKKHVSSSSEDEDNTDDFQKKLRNILSCSDIDGNSETDPIDDKERTQPQDTEIQLIIEALEKTSEKNGKYYNKTFPDYKLREIERNNTLLMNKILSNSTRKNMYPDVKLAPIKVTSNSINRRRKQQEIDHHNLVCLC